MFDLSDLRQTIIPKSDQLNADQLLSGPITVVVTDVEVSSNADQPVSIHYDGEAGRPYKPCKTMRKVLLLAWGHDGAAWVGKSMTLYTDPSVKFGGVEVGGVRISHLSDIPKAIKVMLASTRAKKALHVIDVLVPATFDHLAAISACKSEDEAKEAFARAWQSTKDKATRDDYKKAYDDKLTAIAFDAGQPA